MKIYQGIAVSTGVVIGSAIVLDTARRLINRRRIEIWDIAEENLRLDNAFTNVEKQLSANIDTATNQLGAEYGKIFEAHLSILGDTKLRDEIESLIREKYYSAEYAVNVIFEHHANLLRSIQQNAVLAERVNDLFDIEDHLLCELMGIRKMGLANLDHPSIVLAPNLSPSETANLDKTHVVGIATESGGLGSHTAIVAAALQIPAVLGLGHFLRQVRDGDPIIIDGSKGILILDPEVETIDRYKIIQDKEITARKKRTKNIAVPTQTLDKVDVALYGNIEFPYESKLCMEYGAEGIGLYRTEFLYLATDPDKMPDEEVHFNAYKQVAQTMGDRPVTIRTFDLGADKLPEGVSFTRDKEGNPFMGLRSVRLSLRNTAMFRMQLRAILRASAFGNFRIMFPLVSNIIEFRQAKMLVNDVAEELYEAGIPFDNKIPLGIMVEVPSTVIMLHTYMRDVDFFSIGTNDLVQYTLAVDRSNKEVSSLYNAEDPALLRLVYHAIKVASRYDKPISLCGQMSSNPLYTMLLLGLGLRHFSVTPSSIPEIKEICLKVSIKDCQQVLKEVMFMETAREIRSFLKREMCKVLHEDNDMLDY